MHIFAMVFGWHLFCGWDRSGDFFQGLRKKIHHLERWAFTVFPLGYYTEWAKISRFLLLSAGWGAGVNKGCATLYECALMLLVLVVQSALGTSG